MSNWKSASEMNAYTRQNIEARDEAINNQVPYYMDKVMKLVMKFADQCWYECRIELHPEKGEESETFDLIVSAVRKKLKSLGYSVSNNQTRYGVRVCWATEEDKYPRE